MNLEPLSRLGFAVWQMTVSCASLIRSIYDMKNLSSKQIFVYNFPSLLFSSLLAIQNILSYLCHILVLVKSEVCKECR